MHPDETTLDAVIKLWPLLVSIGAFMIGLATFAVRYQANKFSTDKRITSVEARLLSLETQYHDISKSLTRIETIVSMDRREENGNH